ncbi:hypothetical protein MLD38_025531 [Melastoma candidum]|uniref:Uncharacterized protein n=1 Tax=Melastoma candidum TaxID=119954 RepID=A0ACB9NXF0_9MYRT|nr:hypothetical protein MLD38_025531 [Melastoma candidum]
MQYYAEHDPSSLNLVLAQSLMRTAMVRLEGEFYRILSSNQSYLDPESFGVTFDATSLSESAHSSSSSVMFDLRAIVECMIGAGYGKECVKVYKLVRKSIVQEALYNAGVN